MPSVDPLAGVVCVGVLIAVIAFPLLAAVRCVLGVHGRAQAGVWAVVVPLHARAQPRRARCAQRGALPSLTSMQAGA
ncbi:hypothetical protein [Xanthomonas nasturtii]|nr:hypothetical protein [Xanthomonas nasturtii]